MTQRKINDIRTAHPSRDGDGVAIQRIAGMRHAGMDPILMIDELRAEQREDFAGGFPPHPHRGMQTLTYMKRGGFVHEDSLGNRGEIRGGGAQWMSAGRGIIHSEMPTADSQGMHGFQIWINLPRAEKFSAPRYRDVAGSALESVTGNGFQLTAIAGQWRGAGIDASGPLVELAAQAAVADLALDAGAHIELDIAQGESLLGYVYDGAITQGDRVVGPQQLFVTTAGDTFQIQGGDSGASVLLLRGEPLREPVAHYGPFVMNTPEEVDQALLDYRSGQFA